MTVDHLDMSQPAFADHLTILGALRVARMLPILEVSQASFLSQVEAIVEIRGNDPNASVDDAIQTLSRWRAAYGPIQDLESPLYTQSLVAGIAMAVGGVGELEDRRKKIEHSTANFWDTCGDLVARANGYNLPELADLKTTLRGIEDSWQQRDWATVESGLPLNEVFELRRAKIQTSIVRRRQVALAIARCAGWAG